jgi:hypothetical protein
MELEHGMYEVVYMSSDQKNAYELTAQIWLVAEDDMDNYVFSARPYAGTQQFPKRSIVRMKKIPNHSGVFMNLDKRKKHTPRYVRSQHYGA